MKEHPITKYRTEWSLLICGGVFVYWLIRSWFHIPHDYANSYFGAYFFLRGDFDQSIFDPYTFNKLIFDQGYRQVFVSYSPNPPSTAILFVPFAWLPFSISKLVFNIVGILLFFRTLHRLCKYYAVPFAYVMLVLPIMFFLPIRNQILFGQSYFLIFVLIAEGHLCYEKKQLWSAAVLWAIAIFIKIFPLIILLYLLIRKDWKMTGMLAGFCLTLGCIFLLLQGTDIWRFYLTEILPRSARGELSWAYTTNHQSALMFFKYIFVYDKNLNPQPLVNSPLLFTAALVSFNACILTLGVLICEKRQDLFGLGTLVLVATLLTSAGSTYGNLLLLLILIPCYRSFSQAQIMLISLLVVLIANVPPGYFNSWPIVFQFPRLILLVSLLATLYYLTRPWAKSVHLGIRLAGILLILCVPVLIRGREKSDNSSALLKEERHSIIFDFAIEKGELVYYYWGEQGKTRFATGLSLPPVSPADLKLINNQIYLEGKPITFTPDHKIKPAFVDKDTVIYLSDKGRGYGFYTLRTMVVNPTEKLLSHE